MKITASSVVSWERNDRNNFNKLSSEKAGQVQRGDGLYEYICSSAADLNNKTFLEVGTWNGLGSTQAFLCGLKDREDEYEFFSLESNVDKWLHAKNKIGNLPGVYILNEVILDSRPSLFRLMLQYPILLRNKKRREWLNTDLSNMEGKSCFLKRSTIPDNFDVVFLDGGEYLTYFEFKSLRHRTRMIILDDVLTDKSRRIRSLLSSAPDWQLVEENLKLRNGWSAFRKREDP